MIDKLAAALFLAMVLGVPGAGAAPLTLITSRALLGATDSVNWGQLGGDATSVAQSFTVKSAGNDSIQGSFAQPSGGEVVIEGGPSWIGNFTFGDALIWTTGDGPLTLSFATPVSAAGANFEANTFGAFTAEILAYNGNTLIGSVKENGVSNITENGSAIFIGVSRATADITRVVFNGAAPPGQDFAINSLALRTVPEPAAAALAGPALLALLALRRVRRMGRQ